MTVPRETMAAPVLGGLLVAGEVIDLLIRVGGRTMHQPRFATSSGRARFSVVRLPRSGAHNSELRLMTIRSEGQFNTVVYEDEALYRGQERRDVILLSAADIERLRLKMDQRVTVRSECGEMRGIRVREGSIRSGNAAMYYPEANVLVPARADRESRTPAFKSVLVELEPEVGPSYVQVDVPRPAVSVLSAGRKALRAC